MYELYQKIQAEIIQWITLPDQHPCRGYSGLNAIQRILTDMFQSSGK